MTVSSPSSPVRVSLPGPLTIVSLPSPLDDIIAPGVETVSNGTYMVNMPDEESAQKAAKALGAGTLVLLFVWELFKRH